MKTKLLYNKIIKEFNNNLNLTTFKNFLKSLEYLSDEYIISALRYEENEDIYETIALIRNKYPIYDLEDAFSYYIHLLNGDDKITNSLDFTELELLIKILEEDNELIDIGLNLLIYNNNPRLQVKISELLKKKKPFYFHKSPKQCDLYDDFLKLIIVKKSYFLSSSKKRFIDKLYKQNLIYDYLINIGDKAFADLLIEYLKENDYNSLYNLIKNHYFSETNINKIKQIINNDTNSNYDITDFDLAFLDLNETSNINNFDLTASCKFIYDQYKNDIYNDNFIEKILKEPLDYKALKIILKIKDVYRQYNIDSDDLFSRYGKEKTIFKGLCSLMKIANKNNIGINKINTPKKFIKELTKDKLDSVTDKDKKNALVLLGSSQYGVLTQRVGLRQATKLSEDINEKKSDYEVFIDMLQINQKRILDLIYQDIPEDDFVVLLDELKDKMKPDIYEMLVSLNDHFKMIENKPHNKTKPVENALNDVQNKIDRLKDAYKRVDELEKIYNESFTTKKENICEEILRLQMNEINMLMKNTLELESKHSMAIEVKIEEPKVNRSFDSLKSQNDLSIKR